MRALLSRTVKTVTDINITSKTLLPSPIALCEEIQKTEAAEKFVAESREAINKIIFGDDRRLLVVIGPCSIHDLKLAANTHRGSPSSQTR